jgi:predicted transposase YdaD
MGKHDEFFSRSLEYIALAKAFIQVHIPDHLKHLIDIENISREDRTDTNRDLNKGHRDIIYTVPLKNKADGALIVAIEHQSSKDKMMPIRFLRYTVANLEAWINGGQGQWPTLVNLLLYHGEK